MSCNYFKIRNNIGVCQASSNAHIPGIDEMGRLCFRDVHYTCPLYREYTEQKYRRFITIRLGDYSISNRHTSFLRFNH